MDILLNYARKHGVPVTWTPQATPFDVYWSIWAYMVETEKYMFGLDVGFLMPIDEYLRYYNETVNAFLNKPEDMILLKRVHYMLFEIRNDFDKRTRIVDSLEPLYDMCTSYAYLSKLADLKLPILVFDTAYRYLIEHIQTTHQRNDYRRDTIQMEIDMHRKTVVMLVVDFIENNQYDHAIYLFIHTPHSIYAKRQVILNRPLVGPVPVNPAPANPAPANPRRYQPRGNQVPPDFIHETVITKIIPKFVLACYTMDAPKLDTLISRLRDVSTERIVDEMYWRLPIERSKEARKIISYTGAMYPRIQMDSDTIMEATKRVLNNLAANRGFYIFYDKIAELFVSGLYYMPDNAMTTRVARSEKLIELAEGYIKAPAICIAILYTVGNKLQILGDERDVLANATYRSLSRIEEAMLSVKLSDEDRKEFNKILYEKIIPPLTDYERAYHYTRIPECEPIRSVERTKTDKW